LAAQTEAGLYVSPLKILGVVVAMFLWAKAIAWIDQDTNTVKTRREQWNSIVILGGLLGFVALFLPPWQGPLYFAGLAVWVVIAGGAQFFYILHRNSRVVADAKVLTVGHLARAMKGEGDKRKKKDRGTRVWIKDHEGQKVDPPMDPDEFDDYQATQDFLFDVFFRRASEADLLAGREKYRVVLRVDGVATELPDGILPEEGERVFRYLKRLAGLNIEEIRRPQQGKIQAALLAESADMSDTMVQTSGTTAGERLRLRLHTAFRLMRAPELGLAEPRLELLKKVIKEPTGLVLVSGPPQNGITTTQYAILRDHDAYMQNIHSLERKPQLDLDNITQQVHDINNTEVGYARMLQTVIRREPDVVMVGECEDRETFQLAARAGTQNRKVYVAVRAKDSFDALSRLLSDVDDNTMVAECLVAIINQRLVRILCEECREAYRPDAATLKKLNLPADKIERFYRPPSEPLVDKKGREIICPNCQNSGYNGRTGIYELFVVNDGIRSLIAQGAPINRIRSECRKNKMLYLQEEGLLKVIDGTTSMNEILRVMRENGKKK
jgi:type II secretory ATPase GspE/PulE/Tfp pilus assembly ATPase PilB-like protein